MNVNAIVQTAVETALEDAFQDFKKSPSENNWTTVTGAMLVYQQFRGTAGERRQELCDKLLPLPINTWGEEIVMFTQGKDIASFVGR